MVTGIGSLPFTDVDKAIDHVFASCPEMPVWPQLANRSFLENMYVQFLEDVPSVVVDEQNEKIYVDTGSTSGIERFYDDVASGNLDAFRVSDAAAPGLYRFLDRICEIEDQVKVIKGQLTGPFTLGLGLKDEKGRPIIYNSAYFDIIKRALHMKAAWMISLIRSRFPAKEVMIFFDEPFLVSFGSAYVAISKADVVSLMNEVLGGLRAQRGIHCCGNTDWSVLFSVDAEIINYDAFNFLETIFYFADDLRAFLGRGGIISPGLVPSSGAVLSCSVDQLVQLWHLFGERISAVNQSVQWGRWFVTPSCGLGSLTEQEAVRALELLHELGLAISRA